MGVHLEAPGRSEVQPAGLVRTEEGDAGGRPGSRRTAQSPFDVPFCGRGAEIDRGRGGELGRRA